MSRWQPCVGCISSSLHFLEITMLGGSIKKQSGELHPGRLTWNLRIHPWNRKIIFQTIIFRFYVNPPGCSGHQFKEIFTTECNSILKYHRKNMLVQWFRSSSSSPGPFLQCLSCPSATYAYSSGSTATCRLSSCWFNWAMKQTQLFRVYKGLYYTVLCD